MHAQASFQEPLQQCEAPSLCTQCAALLFLIYSMGMVQEKEK